MDKKLLKWNFIFQYGWVLTNIFNSVLLLPLYLRNIDKDTLGVWLATGSILGWMTLVDPGVGEVLQQKIAELRGRGENSDIGRTIGSGVMACVIIFAIAVLLGLGCYFFVGTLINKDVTQYPYLSVAIALSVLATGLSLVSFGLMGINQGLHNSAQVAVCSVTANFLFLFINLVLLFMHFGVLSIAAANLGRAIYINVYSAISMRKVLRSQSVKAVFERAHFKKFIRIFSVTSASKIITGLSYSIDMVVLARYIPPAMITIYEINKRPINISYSLIGRHSVALMPLISHAHGSADKTSISNLVSTQFRFYVYAAIFASLFFWFNYDFLIGTWTGKGQFAGNTILYLLIGGFFFSLISYFMAIVGYALGDIRVNSMYNISRNIVFGVLMFFAAKIYGIAGTLIVSVTVTVVADLIFYYWRLRKMGYGNALQLKSGLLNWILLLPLSFAAGYGLRYLTIALLPDALHFSRLLVSGGSFSFFFFCAVMLLDGGLRRKTRSLAVTYLLAPINRLRRA